MASLLTVLQYSREHRPSNRRILTKIGWTEQYISAMENAVDVFSKDSQVYRVYLAISNGEAIGFLYVEYYAWNRLCQIQGLAVCPEFQRQGAASALVARAEDFARSRNARGVYVDTPVSNTGGRSFYEAIGYRFGYLMPHYYEDTLDGVTYHKFFHAIQADECGQTCSK